MRLQSFFSGKRRDTWRDSLERGGGVVGKCGLFDKIIDRKGTGKAGGTHGGQGVIGPGQVIAQRLGAGAAQEDRAGVFDLGQQSKGVFNGQLQMLWGQLVGNLDPLFSMEARAISSRGSLASWTSISPATALASSMLSVTSTADASLSCSAWESRSAAK